MEHFDKNTQDRLQGEYRCLILDGHDLYISTEVMQFCITKKIILLCLPPYATHFLQPLDVGIFGPLQ